jgi:hypothetical protein
LRYDLAYLNNWSFGLDLAILLRTLPVVLTRRGIERRVPARVAVVMPATTEKTLERTYAGVRSAWAASSSSTVAGPLVEIARGSAST